MDSQLLRAASRWRNPKSILRDIFACDLIRSNYSPIVDQSKTKNDSEISQGVAEHSRTLFSHISRAVRLLGNLRAVNLPWQVKGVQSQPQYYIRRGFLDRRGQFFL